MLDTDIGGGAVISRYIAPLSFFSENLYVSLKCKYHITPTNNLTSKA
jgi:hypothetical protein